MATTDELIAAANKAVSGPNAGTGKSYHWNAAKEGFAEFLGNVGDAPARAYQLLKAASGAAQPIRGPVTGITSGGAGELPEVDIGAANMFTDYFKNALGVEPMPAPSKGAEVVAGGLRGITSSPIPMGGSGGALAQLLKGLAVSGSAGAGAVAGGQAAESLAPGSVPAQVAGNLFGGLVGGVAVPSTMGIAGIVSRAKTAAQGAMTNPAAQAQIKGAAAKIVDRQVKDAISGTPKAAENITEALRLREKLGPSFSPSVAEMADSPGLTEMQRRFTLTTPQRLNDEVARDSANVAAVREFYSKAAPEAGAPGSIRTAVNQTFAKQADDLAAATEANAAKLPVADQSSIGARAAELAVAEKQAARPAISAAYEKAFNAAGDARIDLAPVIAKTEEILGTKLSQVKPETAPATVAKIKQLVSKQGDKSPEELAYLASVLGGEVGQAQAARSQVTLRDIDDIRKAVNADVASAMRASDPTAAMRLRNLSAVHRTIDEAVALSPVSSEAKTLYGAAIQKYRNEFVPRFKEGANYQMFKDTSLNEPRIMAEKFTSAYFKPDAQGGITRGLQFSNLFGKNQEAKDLTKTGILDIYRQSAVNPQTGAIDFAAHNRFLRNYGRTLTQFKNAGVDAMSEITSVGKAAGELTALQDKLGKLASAMKFDTTDDLINAALQSPKVMGNSLVAIGKDNRESFRRILMDRAWESGTGAGMQKYLTDNARTLKMALSESHLSDMRDISKALEITERAPIRGVLASGGPDVLKNATGVSLATVWSQYRATTGGRQGPATAVFNLAAPVMTKLSQTNFNDVMQKALHDPETAKQLRSFLMATNPSQAAVSSTGLLNKIGRTAKMAAGLVWDSKGTIGRVILGMENYPANTRRSIPAIANTIQSEQQQETMQ